jgi:hypothetical protein
MFKNISPHSLGQRAKTFSFQFGKSVIFRYTKEIGKITTTKRFKKHKACAVWFWAIILHETMSCVTLIISGRGNWSYNHELIMYDL